MSTDTRAARRRAQHRQTWERSTHRPADALLAEHVAMADEIDALRAEVERLTERLAAVTPPVTTAKRIRRRAAA